MSFLRGTNIKVKIHPNIKLWIDNNWVILISFLVLLLPFIALLLVLIFLKKNIFDNADFWYGYMAYFGSVVLAAVAMYQAQKSNKLSEKFDEMNALQNYSLARCTKGCTLQTAHNDDLKITLSGHHKKDSGAIILLEHLNKLPEDTFNEYLVELFFKDFSKAAIKSFEIITKQMACVQEPDANGLQWGDASDDPIPVGFSSASSNAKTYPIWVGDNTFKVLLKIYSPSSGILSRMIENSVPMCLMMQVKLHSVCGICTLMKYKYWFNKENDTFVVDNCESLLIKITQEEHDHAD